MKMNNSEVMQQLKQNGLVEKEIAFIKKWSEKERISYAEAIRRLYRVFCGVSIFLVLLTVLAIFEFFSTDDFISFFLAYFFTVCIFLFFAPMWLGAKIFILVRRRGGNYFL